MAEWLSSRAPLRRPRVLLVQILGADMALLIRPHWGGVPCATTRRTHNYNIQLCTGGIWGEKAERKKKDWQHLLAQVPISKKRKKQEENPKSLWIQYELGPLHGAGEKCVVLRFPSLFLTPSVSFAFPLNLKVFFNIIPTLFSHHAK